MLRFSDERNFARTLAGLSLIVAPLLLLAGQLVGPDLSGDAPERLAEIRENEGRYIASGYLFLVAAWVFVPGLVGLWQVFRGPGVTLGQVAAGLVLIGVITTIAFFGFGAYEYEAAQPDLDQLQMAELSDNVEESGVLIPAFIAFLVGIVIGNLLLAFSLWRRDVVPVWAAASLAVGVVLNFASEDKALLAIGFAFLLFGYASAGFRLLSMSDDDWGALGRVRPESPPPEPMA